MKTGFLLFLLTIFIAALALPQSTPPNSSSPKKAAPKKAVSTKTASAKTASSKTASAKKGKSSKKSVRTAATAGRPRQTTPTPERYRDIQQALVEKGYLKSEPNGVWDAQSTDALRQFQTDRNLSPTGKITSASLIGLGLGPKTNPPEASPPPTPLPAPSVPTPEN